MFKNGKQANPKERKAMPWKEKVVLLAVQEHVPDVYAGLDNAGSH